MGLNFQSSDRLLVIAPHPDDESLATGALIQRASRVGAAIRLVMVTNGDNNPWPQRWVEKRWQIGQPERRRWGAMRRREARSALKKLGFQGETRYLQFPDQGMTSRLLQADAATLERFCCEIQECDPTHIILPSSYDLHSDHNALHVIVQLALQRTGRAHLPQLHFVVHCKRPDLVPCRVAIQLTESERLVKRQAILCHATQMALSRKRFLAFARPEETYYQPVPVESILPHHPVAEAFLFGGALNLVVNLPVGFGKERALYIAGESPTGGSLRWSLALPTSSRKVRLRDTITGEVLRQATVRITGQCAAIKIPIAAAAPFSRLFVKLDYRRVFLDEAGWREVPVRAS